MRNKIQINLKKILLLIAWAFLSANATSAQSTKTNELWRQVEVIRTAHGVPHIRTENLRAAGYALAWLQCEDYGAAGTPMSILRASGRLALIEGYDRVESDFLIIRHRERTLKNYATLSRDVRDVYEGFAAGVNRYVELNRENFPKGMPADFTGQDVAATEIVPMSARKIRNFLNRLNPPAENQQRAEGYLPPRRGDAEGSFLSEPGAVATGSPYYSFSPSARKKNPVATAPGSDSRRRLHDSLFTIDDLRLTDDGSNTWAFAPSRTSPKENPVATAPGSDSRRRLHDSLFTINDLRLTDDGSNTWAFAPSRTSPKENPVATAPGSDSRRRLRDSLFTIDDLRLTNDGSNTWAFAPSRTKSGKAILMRNPHLGWNAGYYEAHVTVPGVVDFYGDFRIGGPFTVIGGFNRHLGWSTTNNSQDLDEIYALDVDPAKPDHYLLDGTSHAVKRDLITVGWRNGDGISTETREFWSTPAGPVIHRQGGKVYIFKFAGDGELRAGEQFLRMMRARSLDEWKAAMKMRARMTSNFTYADATGNIFFIWNAALPLLPHAVTEDTIAIPVKKTSEMWTKYVPFESLPQVPNPKGGYIHNENSSHHYTNVRGPVDTKNAYPNFEVPELSLRSQLAIQLIGGDEKYSLEDVWRLKHNYRMLLADRVKNDLIAAVRATNPTSDVAAGIALVERWDNTASPESRGSTLFEEWWATYSGLRRAEPRLIPNAQRFAKVWSVDDPFNTPRGLADLPRAVESFATAVAEMKRRYGAIDVMWGDVHRVRRGKVDVPVGGCGNDLGCFRIMGYSRAEDEKLIATGGDGWVLAVEFGDVPRAYSILAYGQSSLPESPWHSDQAEMFARGEMKKVAFTSADVEAQAVKKYRPGAATR